MFFIEILGGGGLVRRLLRLSEGFWSLQEFSRQQAAFNSKLSQPFIRLLNLIFSGKLGNLLKEIKMQGNFCEKLNQRVNYRQNYKS